MAYDTSYMKDIGLLDVAEEIRCVTFTSSCEMWRITGVFSEAGQRARARCRIALEPIRSHCVGK